MLVDGSPREGKAIAGRLEELFRDYGMMITPAVVRLAAFHEVENTYLMVFMMLGGLGVIIGTFGLGILLLRNIRQRKQEFALYLVLGFSKKYILGVIMTEHIFMLLAGLLLGLVSAAAAIVPSFLSPGNNAPVVFISGLVLLILLNGLLWIWLPARQALRHKILSGLREE